METSPGTTPTTGAQRVRTSKTGRAYYAVVLASSLYGVVDGAIHGMGQPPLVAIAVATTYEFGGVVTSDMADKRRQLGERAIPIRALSAAIAAGAVVYQFVVHQAMNQTVMAYVFAGISLLGYLVWLIDSGARRRDRLRAENKLPPTGPEYPMTQWLRHPWVTSRARQLALRTPALGLYGSLEQAATEIRTEGRDKSLARKMRVDLTRALGKQSADVLVHTYEFDDVARAVRRKGDPAKVADLFDIDLTPERIAAARMRQATATGRRWWRRSRATPVEATATRGAVTGATEPTPEPATATTTGATPRPRQKRSSLKARVRDNDLTKQRVRSMWKSGKTYAQIMAELGVTRRTVERHTEDIRRSGVA